MTFKSTQVTLKQSQRGELLSQRRETSPSQLSSDAGAQGPSPSLGDGRGQQMWPSPHPDRPAARQPLSLV